ncbi:MAG TPA: transposase [Candidatus Paceibacterota bacterium]
MSRNIDISIGEFYHIYNRGTEKRKIFLDDSYFERFVALLYLCNSSFPIVMRRYQGQALAEIMASFERGEALVDIVGYCLMPNHFHLILREKRDRGISKFMLKLLTAYSSYFNIRNDRSGTLFQGRYGAKHLHDDQYVKYCFSYIHLNPVKLLEPYWDVKGIENIPNALDFLGRYEFSSYKDYIGQNRPCGRLLRKDAFPDFFNTPVDIRGEIKNWLNYKNNFDYQGQALVGEHE